MATDTTNAIKGTAPKLTPEQAQYFAKAMNAGFNEMEPSNKKEESDKKEK